MRNSQDHRSRLESSEPGCQRRVQGTGRWEKKEWEWMLGMDAMMIVGSRKISLSRNPPWLVELFRLPIRLQEKGGVANFHHDALGVVLFSLIILLWNILQQRSRNSESIHLAMFQQHL